MTLDVEDAVKDLQTRMDAVESEIRLIFSPVDSITKALADFRHDLGHRLEYIAAKLEEHDGRFAKIAAKLEEGFDLIEKLIRGLR